MVSNNITSNYLIKFQEFCEESKASQRKSLILVVSFLVAKVIHPDFLVVEL